MQRFFGALVQHIENAIGAQLKWHILDQRNQAFRKDPGISSTAQHLLVLVLEVVLQLVLPTALLQALIYHCGL